MTEDLKSLAATLQNFAAPKKTRSYSAEERRIITGFEEIQQFVEQHNRLPQNHDGNDIFERLYAVRLQQLRKHPDTEALLLPLDIQGILDPTKNWSVSTPPSTDELADALQAFASDDLTKLQHVRSAAEKRAAEEIAKREPCRDFDQFAPLFDNIQHDLQTDVRKTIPYEDFAKIRQGDFFILGGQLAYVAHKDEEFPNGHGHMDARLRVIYSNKTESNLLMRSLQRALSQDNAARRITNLDAGPLFSDELSEGDLVSGTIYVLRSNSLEKSIAQNRELIHKIGVTSKSVASRIANAANQATYLLATVEVVAEYQLVDIHPTKFEKVLHKVFAPTQIDITIKDRFGKPVQPREWFLVPLPAIKEAIDRIIDGTITQYTYNPDLAQFQKNTP